MYVHTSTCSLNSFLPTHCDCIHATRRTALASTGGGSAAGAAMTGGRITGAIAWSHKSVGLANTRFSDRSRMGDGTRIEESVDGEEKEEEDERGRMGGRG